MHDAFGRELKVGDRVMVPMMIEELHLTADYCNVKVVSVATMPPEHQHHLIISAINTQQLLRANDGDDLEYRTQREPLSAVKIVPFKRHFTYSDPVVLAGSEPSGAK